MAIQFNLRATTALNETRVARILNANTLDEASRMGVFDRIKDFFRGGVKAEAIRQLYDQLSAPQPHDAAPLRMLERFEQLRGLATPEHWQQFSVAHQPQQAGDAHSPWSFSLSIGQARIYDSGPLTQACGCSHTQFARHQAIHAGLHDSLSRLREALDTQGDFLNNVQNFIEAKVECMSDDKAVQRDILQRLDDPFFCKANFKGIEPGIPGKSFRAIFEDANGQSVRLELSDRLASNHEFRGPQLRKALAGSDYPDLRTLLSRGHKTLEDGITRGIGHAVVADLLNTIDEQIDPEALEFPAARRFAFVRDLQPVNNPFLRALDEAKIGEVSLLQICFPEQVEQARELALFDQARSREDLDAVLATLQADCAKAAASLPPPDEDAHIGRNAQDITDDAQMRGFLLSNLDNDLFCRDHFQRLEPGDTGATFKAVFQRGDEPEQALVLSNRGTNNGEFRGETVKKLLEGSPYAHLRDLMKTGHQDASDPLVKYVANALMGNFTASLGFETPETTQAYLSHLKEHGPQEVASKVFDALRQMSLASTHLLGVWLGDEAPAAPPPEAAFIPPNRFA